MSEASKATSALVKKVLWDSGSTHTFTYHGAGYLTGNAGTLRFAIPLSFDAGLCTITKLTLTLRQGNNYVFGSATGDATPTSFSLASRWPGGVCIVAEVKTTGATNNAPVGVSAYLAIKMS